MEGNAHHEHNPFQCNLGYQVSLSGKGEWNKQADELANIAMDMEINQYIDGHWLPEGGIDINDYDDLNLDRKAGSRYYYDQLKQCQEDKKQNGSCGDENMDKVLDVKYTLDEDVPF